MENSYLSINVQYSVVSLIFLDCSRRAYANDVVPEAHQLSVRSSVLRMALTY